jgi:hypothetical protein
MRTLFLFVFKDLTKGFIRVVLDEFAPAGNPFGLRDPRPRGIGKAGFSMIWALGQTQSVT